MVLPVLVVGSPWSFNIFKCLVPLICVSNWSCRLAETPQRSHRSGVGYGTGGCKYWGTGGIITTEFLGGNDDTNDEVSDANDVPIPNLPVGSITILDCVWPLLGILYKLKLILDVYYFNY